MPRRKAGLPAEEIPTSVFEVTEFETLDEYLNDAFNYEMYLRERRSHEGLLDLDASFYLTMFKDFYHALSIVKSNLDKPLVVEERLARYGGVMLERLIQYADLLADEHHMPALRDSMALVHITELSRASRDQISEHICAMYDLLGLDADRQLLEQDSKREEDALARGLTIRRLMYLLDNEMPIFKNATTNAARGELAYMLTGLGGVTRDGRRGEKVRQGYSTYARLVNEEDRKWLSEWKAKLQKVPRNKGGTL